MSETNKLTDNKLRRDTRIAHIADKTALLERITSNVFTPEDLNTNIKNELDKLNTEYNLILEEIANLN